ncbi:MAG TPA: alpha/beta hydrolase [Phnomibacter sp.]|nr:alpha/beta hydrolase [Phnomibacter sp.]
MRVSFLKTPDHGIFVLLAVVILSIGCKKDKDNPQDTFDPAIARTLLNEKYGSGERQEADVYLPANRSGNTAVVILLHGGSWMEGNKTDLTEVVNTIRVQWPQAAIINMNYKLANNTPANFHPAQMNDIRQMLVYLNEKKGLWQVGEKVALTGVSAGAHLALLYSYAFDNEQKVKAVVDIVGPTDLSDPFYTNNLLFQVVLTNYLGKTWQQDPDLHRSASPALRVTATSPPTFMAYGGLDPLVPVSNAVTLRNRLQNNGVAHTYLLYPNEGHEFSTPVINDMVPQVVQFLKSNLE